MSAGDLAPVLLTGAAGDVAAKVRPLLAAALPALRLTDCRAAKPAAASESFVKARLERPQELARAMAGVRAVVHLAAAPKNAGWSEIHATDVEGTHNLLLAAQQAGVRRLILAGTMHVLGLYRRDEPITEASPPRPDGPYAAAKLFAEGLGRAYTDRYGMSVSVLRLAHVVNDLTAGEPCNSVLGTDVARLILHELDRPEVGYRILHAVSPCPGDKVTDGRLAAEGFEFTPMGEPYETARARLERWFGQTPEALSFRGGALAAADWSRRK